MEPGRGAGEKAAAGDPTAPWKDRYLHSLGAVLYRAGRLDEAIRVLTASNAAAEQAVSKSPRFSPAYNAFFLAMACHHRGQSEDAQRWLDQGQKWAGEETARNNHMTPQARAYWNRPLTLQLLRREAETLIRGATASPPHP